MGVIEVLQWAIPILIVLYIVGRGFRVHDQQITEWAAGSDLRLTEPVRAMAARYLKWTRRCRTIGGLVGFLVPITYSMTTQDAFPIHGLVLILAGYLMGAVAAEIVVHRFSRRANAALLVARRLSDYLPAYVAMLQRGLAVVSLGLVGVWALTPYPNREVPEPELSTFVLHGLAGIGVAVVIEGLQRLVVARRQAATSPDLLAADDAIRSSSVQALGGAGIGLLLIIVGSEVSAFTPLGGFPGWSLGLLTAFLYFSALFFWLDLGKPHGHKVRRLPPRRAAA
jgi:hypothetical protein